MVLLGSSNCQVLTLFKGSSRLYRIIKIQINLKIGATLYWPNTKFGIKKMSPLLQRMVCSWIYYIFTVRALYYSLYKLPTQYRLFTLKHNISSWLYFLFPVQMTPQINDPLFRTYPCTDALSLYRCLNPFMILPWVSNICGNVFDSLSLDLTPPSIFNLLLR